MSLKDTIRVVQSGQRRIKIFIDFWNVVIKPAATCENFDVRVHWDKLVDHLVSHTRQGYFDETTGELPAAISSVQNLSRMLNNHRLCRRYSTNTAPIPACFSVLLKG